MSSVVELAHKPSSMSSNFAEALAGLRGVVSANRSDYASRLDMFDLLARSLLRPDSAIRRTVPTEGLAYLATFLQAGFLDKLMERELPDRAALVRFTPIGERKSILYTPRGLVCHWVAGNVPLLAMFSFAVSALLGNRNALRLSSRQQDVITPFLVAMSDISSVGKEIAEETVVVRFDSGDTASHRLMSESADARIAWGGQEAVSSIRGLPTNWDCEDIVFGPRASMAVIDPAAMDDGAIRRLATDIAVFDQQACSSPQSVFVKSDGGSSGVEDFVEAFAAAMAQQARAMPRHPLDFAETYRIELDRARVQLGGGYVHRDLQTQWTVAVVESPNDAVQCANRFVQVVPFARFEDVYSLIPLNVQTVVTQLTQSDYDRFTHLAATHGVCRFPAPGEGNNFENPWDGIGLLSRLTRAVVRTDARI